MSLPTDKQQRKEMPIATGVIDYFPDAIAAVANVSFVGNEAHNPGQPMHWSREKSNDHADCIARHLAERGTIDSDGLRHTAKIAWRALALLQLEIEAAKCVCGEPLAPNCVHRQDSSCYVVGTKADPRKPLVYISGPMTDYPDSNFAAFDGAQKELERLGYEVINPAQVDRERDAGKKCESHVYVERDVAALVRIAKEKRPGSCVVMLPGWCGSTGSNAEREIARWLGIEIRNYKGIQEKGT